MQWLVFINKLVLCFSISQKVSQRGVISKRESESLSFTYSLLIMINQLIVVKPFAELLFESEEYMKAEPSVTLPMYFTQQIRRHHSLLKVRNVGWSNVESGVGLDPYRSLLTQVILLFYDYCYMQLTSQLLICVQPLYSIWSPLYVIYVFQQCSRWLIELFMKGTNLQWNTI